MNYRTYNIDAAINLRNKTWIQAGYQKFCSRQEQYKVISFKDSVKFTNLDAYEDIPDCWIAVTDFKQGSVPTRKYYTKEIWKQAWSAYRAIGK